MTPQEPASKMPPAGGIPPEVLALAQMTLDEFEGTTWETTPEDATYVQHTCYELRRTPWLPVRGRRSPHHDRSADRPGTAGAYGPRRALIQQPLIEADMYPGDLLRAVLALPDSFASPPRRRPTPARRRGRIRCDRSKRPREPTAVRRLRCLALASTAPQMGTLARALTGATMVPLLRELTPRPGAVNKAL